MCHQISWLCMLVCLCGCLSARLGGIDLNVDVNVAVACRGTVAGKQDVGLL